MKIANLKLKILLSLLFLATIYFIFPSPGFASTNFITDYNVIYTVNEDNLTKADMTVTLTNTTAEFYASSYQIKLGFDSITNLKAQDPLGEVKNTLKKTPDGYDLSLDLNRKSLGLGNKLILKITFDTESIARTDGKIKEVSIPGIANPEEFNSFTVEIKPPSSYGTPSYIKPFKKDNMLVFDKKDLGKSGISVAFGDKKSYGFKLKYHLKNRNLYPKKSEIALPPDTNYQKVFITGINPRPINVRIDKDGNWLAAYSLSPSSRQDVEVTGWADISLSPASTHLTADEKSIYTKPTKYWQADDQKIKKLAQELKTPERIYGYVVKTLKYDFEKVSAGQKRLGALGALKNPENSVCREFTDLFIAISRSAGIPSREVDGFAYTKSPRQRPVPLSQDILHTWPEYYDFGKKTWIMVDPTWGGTTGGIDYFNILDFDHFAFAIKGIDDSSPTPAGGYKSGAESRSKDVEVVLSDKSPTTKQSVKMTIDSNNSQIAGLPMRTKVKIENAGPSSVTSPLIASTKDLTPFDQASGNLIIPPFGKQTVDIKFDNTSFLTNKEAFITMRLGDSESTEKLRITPFFMNQLGIGGVAIGILTITLLIFAGKSRRLRLHR